MHKKIITTNFALLFNQPIHSELLQITSGLQISQLTCASVGWLLSLKSIIFSEHRSSTAIMARVIAFWPSIDACKPITHSFIHHKMITHIKCCVMSCAIPHRGVSDMINQFIHCVHMIKCVHFLPKIKCVLQVQNNWSDACL